MDYKKIIPNKKIRIKILNMLDFVPDKFMVSLQYRISTGRTLNLENPKRYTEKLQWYKLNYRNPLMTYAVDKREVHKYVKSKGLKDILVPLYGSYTSVDEINFDQLPKKFVLKTTNGSQTNIICENKDKLDIEKTKVKLSEWMNKKRGKLGREWAYYNVQPKIIAEKLLETDDPNGLIDYKIFCFNGIPENILVVTNRSSDTKREQSQFFDLNFNKLSYKRKGRAGIVEDLKAPKYLEQMIEIAKILSKDFPHVRVDLYNINGKIYFSELTFYNDSGYVSLEPDEFDYLMGEKFTIV